MKSEKGTVSERIAYLDDLRILATFAVIILHLSAQNWYTTDVNGFAWQVFNVYDSLVRWAVPMFVMISGVVFLGREWNVKTILSKYVLRLATAFFFWGLVYALVTHRGFTQVLKGTIAGYNHMWFLPMIIGLYLCIPIFQKIAASEKVTAYFLGLCVLFGFVLPQLETMITDLRIEGAFFQEIVPTFFQMLAILDNSLIGGYACYYIGGYYLSRAELSAKARRVLYALGAAGFLGTIFLSSYFSVRRQVPRESYYESFTVNVLLEGIALFVWFRYHPARSEKWRKLAHRLAKYSFGAYLVHMLVIEQLDRLLHINTLSFSPVLSVPILGILVFGISFAISGLLNQIPVLKKFIV